VDTGATDPKTLEEPAEFVRGIIKRSLAVTVAAAVLLGLIGGWHWGRGLGLGGLASVVNFWLMAGFLPRTLNPSRGKAEVLSLLSILVRFSVMAAAMGVALIFPQRFSIALTIVGLFMVQITLISGRVLGFGPSRPTHGGN